MPSSPPTPARPRVQGGGGGALRNVVRFYDASAQAELGVVADVFESHEVGTGGPTGQVCLCVCVCVCWGWGRGR